MDLKNSEGFHFVCKNPKMIYHSSSWNYNAEHFARSKEHKYFGAAKNIDNGLDEVKKTLWGQAKPTHSRKQNTSTTSISPQLLQKVVHKNNIL